MILADTQIVIWTAFTPATLSVRASEALEHGFAHDGVAVSDKTLWELAMAVRRGRVKINKPLSDFLRAVERRFIVLPITSAIAEQAVSFSDQYPRDPTDRIIGATAVVHRIKLITSDALIHASNEVDCVW